MNAVPGLVTSPSSELIVTSSSSAGRAKGSPEAERRDAAERRKQRPRIGIERKRRQIEQRGDGARPQRWHIDTPHGGRGRREDGQLRRGWPNLEQDHRGGGMPGDPGPEDRIPCSPLGIRKNDHHFALPHSRYPRGWERCLPYRLPVILSGLPSSPQKMKSDHEGVWAKPHVSIISPPLMRGYRNTNRGHSTRARFDV